MSSDAIFLLLHGQALLAHDPYLRAALGHRTHELLYQLAAARCQSAVIHLPEHAARVLRRRLRSTHRAFVKFRAWVEVTNILGVESFWLVLYRRSRTTGLCTLDHDVASVR